MPVRRAKVEPHGRWHLDEMVLPIAGESLHMWRAVDSEGEALDILMQRRRDKAAALKLLKKQLKSQGFAPTATVTDKLGSSTAPRSGACASLVIMNRVCAPITGQRIHINLSDDANAKCEASNHPGPLSVSYRLMPPSKTHSTCNDT